MTKLGLKRETTAILLVLAVALGGGGGYFVGVQNQHPPNTTRTVTELTSSTLTFRQNPPPYNNFSSLMLDHLVAIAALNSTEVSDSYIQNASLEFEGLAGGLTGTYAPKANITALWRGLLSGLGGITINNFSATVLASPDRIDINSTFNFIRYFSPGGPPAPSYAVVAAYSVFIRSGAGWGISMELWRFYLYPMTYP